MKWTVFGFILLFSFGCSKNAGEELRSKEASAEMSAYVGVYELTADQSDTQDSSSRRIILRGDGTFVEGTMENPDLNTGTWQVPQGGTEAGDLVENQEVALTYSKGPLIDQVFISRLSADDRLSMVAKIVAKEREAIPLAQQDSFKKVLSGLHPLIPFLIALSLLGMFIWYFGTDSDHKQRWIGTLLTLGIVGFCVYSVLPPEEKIKRGMDLAGGARFTLKLEPGIEAELTPQDQDQAVDVLNTRLNALGTSDVKIAKQGDDQIIVDVPNSEGQKIDDQRLKQLRTILTQAAVLNFHLSHIENGTPEVVSKIKAGENPLVLDSIVRPFRKDMGNARDKMLLEKEPGIRGEDVTDAWTYNEAGNWSIMVSMKGRGKDALYEMSRNNVNNGRSMAIVLDDEIISAPGFNEAIPGGTARITGDFNKTEAITLATSMKNPLRSKPQVIYEEYFPPTLAKSAINQGLLAGAWGLGLTALFMLLFYRFAGIIALLGLSVNVILLFGILAIFQADFTLAGIAGVILTIGIAIDANVLIYERLREEMATGKSLGTAIKAAYEKAFSAIFDAQITTLITALVLLWLAEGAIKGFAVTLTIGILVSLFSALLVTRVCFNWLTTAETLRSLKFMKVLGRRTFDFLSAAKTSRFISFALILTAIGVITMKGTKMLGIEFSGGDQIRFQAATGTSSQSVKDAIAGMTLIKTANIQTLTPVGGTGTIFSVRIDKGKGSEAKALIADKGLAEGEIQTQEVSSVVAGKMLRNSLYALCAGLLAIFIYVTFRFELSFALGAIIALVHDLVIAIGITVLSGRELNLILVGAFLTIAGYSINDTIVVFDRIREGLRSKRGEVKDIMNLAINTTLSRTLLTSLTTLLTVSCLFAFGGPALSDFSFAIIIGIVIGTYSSIFVASPVVYWWAARSKTNLRREVLDAEQETAPPAATGS
ncbi:MAG: protein translocase subunit SecD [Verrucomicrobiales bacterium]